jgi:hypothetical protein
MLGALNQSLSSEIVGVGIRGDGCRLGPAPDVLLHTTHPIVSGAMLVGMLLAGTPAFALNPTLDVSQYAHTAWKIRDGFAKGSILSIAQTPDGFSDKRSGGRPVMKIIINLLAEPKSQRETRCKLQAWPEGEL